MGPCGLLGGGGQVNFESVPNNTSRYETPKNPFENLAHLSHILEIHDFYSFSKTVYTY